MIKVVLFDFDQTLVDSGFISFERSLGDWSAVAGQLEELEFYPGIKEVLDFLEAENIAVGVISQSPREVYLEPACKALDWSPEVLIGYHDTERRKPDPEPLKRAVMAIRKGSDEDYESLNGMYPKRPYDFFRYGLGLRVDQILAVGDTCTDIEAARRLHISSVGAIWGASDRDELYLAKPDYVCKEPTELIALVQDLKHRQFKVPRGDFWSNRAVKRYRKRIKNWFSVNTTDGSRKWLKDGEECFHLRRRVKGGWSESVTNAHVWGFKSKKESQRWAKEMEAKRFAEELAEFLAEGATCLFIPGSKKKDHPEFDPRFELLEAALERLRPDLTFIAPVTLIESQDAAHESDEADLRDPAVIVRNYSWDAAEWNDPDQLYVIDDVMTSGGHFKAVLSFVRQHGGEECVITGVAWALEV